MIDINYLREAIKNEGPYELYVGHETEDYKVVANIDKGSHRWTSLQEVIIHASDGKYYGFTYEEGLTELQDNEYPWEYRDDWEIYEVIPTEVTTTKYERVK